MNKAPDITLSRNAVENIQKMAPYLSKREQNIVLGICIAAVGADKAKVNRDDAEEDKAGQRSAGKEGSNDYRNMEAWNL